VAVYGLVAYYELKCVKSDENTLVITAQAAPSSQHSSFSPQQPLSMLLALE